MGIIQEKYQVNYPQEAPELDTWISDKRARVKKNTPGREGRPGGDPESKTMDNAVHYNSLPPGMDMEDQEMTDQRVFNESISGNFSVGKNAGDLTQDLTPMVLKEGFSHKKMLPTDDMYTREYNPVFYDDITVDGVTGFVERGNVLDRE